MRIIGGSLFSLGPLGAFLERRVEGALSFYTSKGMLSMSPAARRRAALAQADIRPIRLSRKGEMSLQRWTVLERMRDEELAEVGASYRAGWSGDLDLWFVTGPGRGLRPVHGRLTGEELILTADVMESERDFTAALIRSEDAAIRKHLARQFPMIREYRASLKARIAEAI